MKMRILTTALLLSLVYGSPSFAELTITKVNGDSTLTRLDSTRYTTVEDGYTLTNLYRTLSTPAISGELFLCYAVNVSDFPATIKQVTIYDSDGALGEQSYARNNIVATCPYSENDNELVLLPHETCAVSVFIPTNREDDETTAAHCIIRFKNENVIVKGSMEANRWVDLFTGGNVSVNSGGFWTKMRVDASE